MTYKKGLLVCVCCCGCTGMGGYIIGAACPYIGCCGGGMGWPIMLAPPAAGAIGAGSSDGPTGCVKPIELLLDIWFSGTPFGCATPNGLFCAGWLIVIANGLFDSEAEIIQIYTYTSIGKVLYTTIE